MPLTAARPPVLRRWTPARVLALLLIAAVAAGLGLLHLAGGNRPVTVPEGARAGQLALHRCTYDTEAGGRPADCGTLVVPERRGDPRSRLIALPVIRIRARSASPGEPVFHLEGGPGGTNTEFEAASRFTASHDVVLVGYRGVDGSSVLDCPEVTSALRRSGDLLGTASLRAHARALRSCASRLQADGVDLGGYTLPEQAEDVDAARRALGYPRIDLLSQSAGTRLALEYTWRHPARVHRSVLVGANPPGHFLWDPADTDELVGRYSRLCAQDAACRARTGDLPASMRRTAGHLPERWGPLTIAPGDVRIGSFYGLMHATPAAAPLTGPMVLDAWHQAADGDASGLWLISLLSKTALPPVWTWGEGTAIGRADTSAAQAHFAAAPARGSVLGDSVLGDPGSQFLWAGGRMVSAWPAAPGDDARSSVPVSQVETLVVGGELDGATPARAATQDLLPFLPDGHQVVLAGFGHNTDFWGTQPAAGRHLVTTFLDTGRVDASWYTPQRVDLTPSLTYPLLAKGLVAVLAGLALVTVLSLLRIASRVHTRGRLGRRSSAVLRTAFLPVLGLGGWCLGALVALAALPAVPVDDEVLVVLSVSAPVALGAWGAWTGRDQRRRTRVVGLLAAFEGATLGAGLAAAALPGPLGAVLGAVVGAAAGANLGLVVHDLVTHGQRHSRAAQAPRSGPDGTTPQVRHLAATTGGDRS